MHQNMFHLKMANGVLVAPPTIPERLTMSRVSTCYQNKKISNEQDYRSFQIGGSWEVGALSI